MDIIQFSSTKRHEILKKITTEEQDLLIIGGGITGCGIALDSTTRGIKTALVDMQDFGAGTSSRSTKLVHGGLRYLKQFEIKMVAEVGKERAIVFENGPHVTKPEWMLLPIYEGGTFGTFSTSIGLRVYDFLANVKISERRTMLSRDETIEKEPLLKTDGLKGSGYYVEYRTDDARLTIEVLKEAVTHGAKAVNYAKVIEFLYKDGNVSGVKVEDQCTGNIYNIFAKKIVNATGPWVDTLRQADRSLQGKKLRLTKGVHIVIDSSKFSLQQAIYFDTPDGRMVFAIPRAGKTYVGTTDTFYNIDPIQPKATEQDRQYIIAAINYMFPTVQLTSEDIESSWAGVRPLIYEEGKDPSEISRKDEIWESESGLITIAGGKLTGYRKMAETVVDLVTAHLQQSTFQHFHACQTRKLPISGGHFGGPERFAEFIAKNAVGAESLGFSVEGYENLVRHYGSNITAIFDLAKTYDPANTYDLPLDIYVEVMYAIDYEMAVKPVDFFVRRTGALFFNIDWVHRWKQAIINLMADKLGWSAEEKTLYSLELEEQLHDAIHPSGTM